MQHSLRGRQVRVERDVDVHELQCRTVPRPIGASRLQIVLRGLLQRCRRGYLYKVRTGVVSTGYKSDIVQAVRGGNVCACSWIYCVQSQMPEWDKPPGRVEERGKLCAMRPRHVRAFYHNERYVHTV